MIRPFRKKIGKKYRFWMFRAKFKKLYEEFEANLEELCQRHGVEINFWYSPSKIPQPKFVFGRIGVDADTLYDEEAFNLLFAPMSPEEKRERLTNKSKKRDSAYLQIHKKLTHQP